MPEPAKKKDAPQPAKPWAGLLLPGLASAGFLWWWLHQPPSPPRSVPPPSPFAAHSSTTALPQPILTLVPAVPAAPQLAWKINGILVGQGKPTAIVNGQVVEEGDEIAGAKVVRVDPDQVEILQDGETIRLSMERPKR